MDNNKKTNEEWIRSLPIDDLAIVLINEGMENNWDEDYDGQMYVCGSYDVYTTSDGEVFYDEEDAVDHEVSWLKSEV